MIIVWCILGCICGIIAGLIPGLHSNNIAVILAATPFFGMEITSFMLSMCVTQSFVEFIPSTYLACPNENTFESVLPAHKMLLEGKATQAISHTVLGGLTAVIAGAALTIPFFIFLEENSTQIVLLTPVILTVALIIFLTEPKGWRKKSIAFFVLAAASCQGFLFQDKIFALIGGYFGVAGLIYSIKNNEQPIQTKQSTEYEIETSAIKDALIGVGGGAIVSVMPGIGSNTAGGIINTLRKTPQPKNYLTMLGAINMSNFFFSLAMLLALSKTRNGTMIALMDKIFYTPQTLFIGTVIMVLAAGIGGISTIILAKKAAVFFNGKITKALNITCIAIIAVIAGFMYGKSGIIALGFATALGILTITQGIRRSTLMSSLITPTIFFYLFILI